MIRVRQRGLQNWPLASSGRVLANYREPAVTQSPVGAKAVMTSLEPRNSHRNLASKLMLDVHEKRRTDNSTRREPWGLC